MDRRTSKACDPCKRRKVRCNGQNRCQQCTHNGLKCTYSVSQSQQPRRKTVRRGAVIAECRTNSHLGQSNALLVPRSLTAHPNQAFFLDLLGEYEEYVYPMSPVITASEIREIITNMDASHEHASFAYIFAAVTLNLTRSEPVQEAPATTSERISTLVTRSLELRQPLGIDSQPTIMAVMSSLFTQVCLVGLRRLDLGFLYLREAISLLYMLHAHSAEDMAVLDLSDRARLQRAYWECFIHERFTALTYNRPPCLAPLTTLPEHDPSLPQDIEVSFNHCIDNFRLVDRQFLDFWLGDRSSVTVDWVEEKQRQLEDSVWHSDVSGLPQMLQADLIITRHWLRTLTWQIALSNTLLSSSPGSSLLLSLSFPLRLSNLLRQFLMTIPRGLVGMHGSGILEKLFEIANTITDVVLHMAQAPGSDTVQRIYDILFLKEFVYSFPGLQKLRPELLTRKFEMIRDKYPGIKEMDLLV